jgi:hypothetical protein
MPATVIINNRVAELPGAIRTGETLHVPLIELPGTGWELKPEGACLGDVCVPLPGGREREFSDGGMFNLTALAAHLDQPVVREGERWAIGESAGARTSALQSLEAPDFELPDLEGRRHRLSDYRGRRVFLVSWASW